MTKAVQHVVPVTQHIRPNNRLQEGILPIKEEGIVAANKLLKAGYSIHAEQLNPSAVYLTVEYPFGLEMENGFGSAICANGPKIQDKLTKMLIDCAERLDQHE